MNDILTLSCTFIERHPVEAAQIVERFPLETAVAFLKALPTQTAASLLRIVNPFTVTQLLAFMTPQQTAEICQMLPLATVSALLRRIGADQRRDVLEWLPLDFAAPLQGVMRYAEGTVGALMKTRILVLPNDITVEEGLARLRQNPDRIFDYTYIVDRAQKLTGFVKVRHLMLAQSGDPISMVMKKITGTLKPQMGPISIVTHPGWRTLHALPVVDAEGVFLGAVAYSTLRKLEDEAEDSQLPASARDAGKALGELYWLGIAAFFKGATAAIGSENRRR